MNVYKFECTAGYGGGEAIVAANNKYEAYGALVAEESFYSEHFNLDNCDPLVDLEAKVDSPTVISVEYYVE